MAKIIVESDKNGLYQFVVRRDTNRTIASSGQFPNKGTCNDAIALFLEYAKDAFYWTHKRSKIRFCHYSEWEKNGVVVKGKLYTNLSDMKKALALIINEVSFKTPILHTNIQNPKYHESTIDNSEQEKLSA